MKDNERCLFWKIKSTFGICNCRELAMLRAQKNEFARKYMEDEAVIDILKKQIAETKRKYPIEIGHTVYNITQKDKDGRYTADKPCRETSTVAPALVTENNYFDLVRRLHARDVFIKEDAANRWLEVICRGGKENE